MKKVFLATGNKKKIEELRLILADLNYEVYSIADGIEIPEVIEDGDSFEANSQKKAKEIAKYLNYPALADDSGLCVSALDMRPGVYSARYAGDNATDSDNNKKLISELSGEENREARFVCVISVAKPNGEVISFRGEVKGEIVNEAKGSNGFGYDPHFYYLPFNKTFAELEKTEKNQISHRANAVKLMKNKIKDFLR